MRIATLLLCAPLFAPFVCAQEREKRLQQEIDQLRQERNRLQDQLIERERTFDQVKRKLLEEKEAILGEMARLTRDSHLEQARLQSRVAQLEEAVQRLGGEIPPPPPSELEETKLDAFTRSVDLEARPLSVVEELFSERLKVELANEGLGALRVTLRTGRLTYRALLDLLTLNAVDAKGARVDLTWRREEDKVVIERARKR